MVPPLQNTTFEVVFLARQVGSIENTLYIHSSKGSFKYQVGLSHWSGLGLHVLTVCFVFSFIALFIIRHVASLGGRFPQILDFFPRFENWRSQWLSREISVFKIQMINNVTVWSKLEYTW